VVLIPKGSAYRCHGDKVAASFQIARRRFRFPDQIICAVGDLLIFSRLRKRMLR
jgi:hypothetical protein